MKIISVLMISTLFIFSGYDKIINFNGVVSSLNSKIIFNSLPLLLSQLAMIIAIVLELASPILMLYGIIKKDKRYVIAGLSGLIIFTVLATIFYHPLPQDKTAFMKNMSIIGGLLLVILNYSSQTL